MNKIKGNKLTVLGPVKHFQPLFSGISGKTENGYFKITAYGDNTIRVQVSRESEFLPNPYTVIGQPTDALHTLVEDDDHIHIQTGKINITITKENFSLIFKDKEGKVISEDDPAFGINWLGTEVSNYKKLQKGEKFIGLGEKTGGLNRWGKAFVNWNTDHSSYGADDDPLYLSVPFYIGLHHGLSYGIFLDNTHKTTFNFGASNKRFSYFSADDGDLDYYFFHDKTVSAIISAYGDLTGKMDLPPKWSLGYQQCRYSYYPEKEVVRLAETFRDKNIPGDVIYLDIHHMEQYKVFTFDGERFPDPKTLIAKLKELGFKVVVILDPGIKTDNAYPPYLEGSMQDLFLKYPDDSFYEGQVWPGWCVFPDFTNPKARDWWMKKMAFYTDAGVDGFWTDMNEPATWGQFTPNIVGFDFEGDGASHKKGRNVYGMQMARSTKEGQKLLKEENRPFVLSRSGFSGIQRYAAVWTGDNVANDEHMMVGIRLVNSLGISGIPFAGYDIGGFAGNTSPHLFARWISIASFSPLFRAHTTINSNASEPWSFGEEVEQISRNFIKLRYKLLPIIYSSFYQCHLDGLPLVKSLAIDHPFDDLVFHGNYENQYIFCEHFLVAPIESYKQFSKVYLPEGEWYYFFTGKKFRGNQEIYWECPLNYLPVFVKSGAILTIQDDVNHINEPHSGILKIHIYKGTGISKQMLYEDDGISIHHQSGNYYKREILLDSDKQLIEIGQAEGNFPCPFHQLNIYFHGFGFQQAEINGKNVSVVNENIAFLDAISSFDPLPDSKLPFYQCEGVPNVKVDLDGGIMSIKLK
jgi:alpha-glucosidase